MYALFVTPGSILVEMVEAAEDELDVDSLVVVGSAMVVVWTVVVASLLLVDSALVVVSAMTVPISVALRDPSEVTELPMVIWKASNTAEGLSQYHTGLTRSCASIWRCGTR